jgi:hypothetical protein
VRIWPASYLADELLPSFRVDYCLDISGAGFFEPTDQSFKAFGDGWKFIVVRRERVAFNISDFLYDGRGTNWPHEIQQSSKALATVPNCGPLPRARVAHGNQPLKAFYPGSPKEHPNVWSLRGPSPGRRLLYPHLECGYTSPGNFLGTQPTVHDAAALVERIDGFIEQIREAP